MQTDAALVSEFFNCFYTSTAEAQTAWDLLKPHFLTPGQFIECFRNDDPKGWFVEATKGSIVPLGLSNAIFGHLPFVEIHETFKALGLRPGKIAKAPAQVKPRPTVRGCPISLVKSAVFDFFLSVS